MSDLKNAIKKEDLLNKLRKLYADYKSLKGTEIYFPGSSNPDDMSYGGDLVYKEGYDTVNGLAEAFTELFNFPKPNTDLYDKSDVNKYHAQLMAEKDKNPYIAFLWDLGLDWVFDDLVSYDSFPMDDYFADCEAHFWIDDFLDYVKSWISAAEEMNESAEKVQSIKFLKDGTLVLR